MFIIEVTGVSGSGKSYFLNALKKEKNFKYHFDSDLILKYGLNDLKLLYLFFKTKSSFKVLLLLIQVSFKLKFNLLDKLNFIRNSIKKIAKNHFFKSLELSEYVIVDEGVSHIYQNILNDTGINEDALNLIDAIYFMLDVPDKIVVIEADNVEVYKRLQNRGHKRINNNFDIIKFIKNSVIMMDQLKKVTLSEIVVVENNGVSSINIEYFLNKCKGNKNDY